MADAPANTPSQPSPPRAVEERDRRFMTIALEEADRGAAMGEVPVGAVLVDDTTGQILARTHNRRELDADPTAHAEIVALREAARARGSWRLDGTTLYVTLEPCAMCAGAMVNARLGRLVFGCTDPKAGACESLFQIGADTRLNHRFPIASGVLEGDCRDRLRRFFAALRALGKK